MAMKIGVDDMGRDMGHDMGSIGSPGPATPGQIPIGVLTPGDNPSSQFPITIGAAFPRRGWDPALYAHAVVAEFGASGWMDGIEVEPPDLTAAALASEINVLLFKAGRRTLQAAELAAQANSAAIYWADMLMASPMTRPGTWQLIEAANAVGHMVAMHFKAKFQRPRPVQVYPALMPPVLTPPHPSYPNAHALESMLIAECVTLAAPSVGAPLRTLAKRVGENREILGVHFPSDTAASLHLVPQILDYLTRGPLFQAVVQDAATEWAGTDLGPLPMGGPKPA